MRYYLCLLALAVLAANYSGAAAADLDKIERRIAREPAYKTKPKYCLLVFGAQAKSRVWLVQDGDTLYVDRNANGDLTEKDNRVVIKTAGDNYRSFEAGDIHDGALTHSGLSVTQMKVTRESVGNEQEFQRISKNNSELWTWWVRVTAERDVAADEKATLPKKIGYVINGDGLGYLLFADRPQDAPIIHLNGPWSIGLQDIKQQLIAGHKTMLQIGIGTQGVGPGTFAFVLYPNTIPNDAYPRAEITFPAGRSGDKPVQLKLELKQRC
jgi:hypothetical protein